MKYWTLPHTDISVSQMSMGTWGFSGVKLWGESDDAVAIQTIHMALDRGINLIDVAERYGNGKAEEVLGKALKGRRSKAVVASKVYFNAMGYDEVIAHCEASLRRLNTDYIDLYQIHWPNPSVPLEETLSAFDKLKADGKIRAVGVCNFGTECIGMAGSYPLTTNQLPYSLIWRQVEKGITEATVRQGMAVWAYSPLAQGLLTGKFKTLEDVPLNRRETRFYNCKWEQGRHKDSGFEEGIFSFLPKLQTVCEETGFTMSTLALAFLKAQPWVGSVLIGSRNPAQLEENIKAFDTDVPAEVISRISALSESLKEVMGNNADLWESADGGRMF